MSQLLSVVEDVFDISGRGIVVAPGIPPSGKWHVRIGDPLLLQKPDGTIQETSIRGIEMCTPPSDKGRGLLLGLEFKKVDVPIGTELWIE